MRTRLNILASVAVLSLFAVGCSQTPDPDSRDADAIRQADLAWAEAQASDGLDGTMSFYLDDAIMLPPNRPMAIGKEAIREASEAMGIASPGFSVRWHPMKIEVARSGDIGYAIGTFEGTVVDAAGNPLRAKGKYVEIWKKQADGGWRVAADMFSPDSPPQPGRSEAYVFAHDDGEELTDPRGRTTIIKISPETGANLLAMGTQDMPPGSNIRVHRHDQTEEILYVDQGSGTLILGDKRIRVDAGATVWVPPGTWHGVENPDSAMRILWFVTPPGLEGFFRAMFWHPGEQPKQLSAEEIAEIERKHDQVAR